MSEVLENNKSEDDADISGGENKKSGQDKPASLKSGTGSGIGSEIGKRSGWITLPLRLVQEFASVVLSLSMLWLIALSYLMGQPSVDLKIVKPHYEHWFSQAFAGKSTEIDHYSARWLQNKSLIEIRAEGVHIKDGTGLAQTIADVRGQFRIRPDALASPQIVGLEIRGGALTLFRDANKRVHLAMGSPETYQKVGPLWQSRTGAPEDLLKNIEHIGVENARLNYRDAASGTSLDMDEVSGDIYVKKGEFALDIAGLVKQGTAEPAAISLSASGPITLDSLRAEVFLNNARPAFLASKGGKWAGLKAVNAPVDGYAHIRFGPNLELNHLRVEATSGTGILTINQIDSDFSYSNIEAEYDPATGQIDLKNLEVESERLAGVLSGNLRPVSGHFSLKEPVNIAFATEIKKARFNPGSLFPKPLNIKSARFKGLLDMGEGLLQVQDGRIETEDFTTRLNADVSAGKAGLTALRLSGVVNEAITPQILLSYWPENYSQKARLWVKDRALGGTLAAISYKVALDEKDLAGGILPNDHLDVRFAVNNAKLKYIMTMPPMTAAKGTGRLQGNQFDIRLEHAKIETVTVTGGEVHIPKLMPKDGSMFIKLQADGALPELLKVVNHPPFLINEAGAPRFNLQPERFSGQGAIDVEVRRPVVKVTDLSKVDYHVTGQFSDVATRGKDGKALLHNGKLDIDMTPKGINISGPVQVWKWPATFDWEKKFTGSDAPAHYSLSGVVGRAELDSFGFGLRQYFGGKFAVLIKGQSDGLDIKNAEITADLSGAELSINKYWAKPKGASAQLDASVNIGHDGVMSLKDIRVQAAGLEVTGKLDIAQDLRLLSMDLSRFKVKDFADIAIKVKPQSAQQFEVLVIGEYLDLSDWATRAFQPGAKKMNLPVSLRGQITQLKLDRDFIIKNAELSYLTKGGVVMNSRLNGMTDEGKFSVHIATPSLERPRLVLVELPNAAKAAHALFGLSNIQGGRMRIKGTLPPSGQAGGFVGATTIEDFVLVKAPAFAKLLSLASLSGLSDTLSGKGLKFTQMDMKFSWDNGQLEIRDGRASGPALGLTGEGMIDFNDRIIDLDGVIVPSYSVNSVLGDIPLIGDIVVGKKGEGMFALNYAVKGRFDKTQISVNPISALTPGFLRRIFDVKRKDIKEMTDPDVADLIKRQKRDRKNKKKEKRQK